MIQLNVTQFSCIKSATIQLNKLTLLIGPQASGKSVLSKLFYFSLRTIGMMQTHVRDGKSFETYNLDLLKEFERYFPVSAWGKKKFVIKFDCGPFSILFERAAVRKRGNVKLRFASNDLFATEYAKLSDDWRRINEKSQKGKRRSPSPRWQNIFELQQIAENSLKKHLKEDYIEFSFFVPAGRSYFTSLGKAIAVFEHAGSLDPITLQFGRMFTSLRDRPPEFGPFTENHQDTLAHSDDTGITLLGGRIRSDREGDYLETLDGRRVSFSFLSSGQQELLPLWEILNQYVEITELPWIVFIEEPEAHLFPSAQNTLVQYLSSYLNLDKTRKMFITTHSPYVLAKINNLLKAHSTAKATREKGLKVEGIIPRRSWLSAKDLSAYAICDGIVRMIMEGGLIDATYLDEVSSEMAEEFTSLLEIEYEKRTVD